ncbi:MAG: DUF4839 domain-containing protein [Oscillospiraceae bacterium]|nr:DUF4839 domain-containing protein [Oscillospiraceae bacterium]
MKRLLALCLSIIVALALVGCASDAHLGEAKTPSGSRIQKGRDYQDVLEDFEERGFTNIKLEKIEDLILGWFTKDGEVESVSVDGSTNYSPDEWYPNDVEVVISYHTFPSDETEDTVQETEPEVTTQLTEETTVDTTTQQEVTTSATTQTSVEGKTEAITTTAETTTEATTTTAETTTEATTTTTEATTETTTTTTESTTKVTTTITEATTDTTKANNGYLTIDNCDDLEYILTLNADRDESFSKFSTKYRGKTVAFEASIDYTDNHYDFNPFTGKYKMNQSVCDVLISYGDYSSSSQLGPTFKVESITSRSLGYDTSRYLPDFMSTGSNVYVVLKVGEYDSDTGLFYMDLVSIEER